MEGQIVFVATGGEVRDCGPISSILDSRVGIVLYINPSGHGELEIGNGSEQIPKGLQCMRCAVNPRRVSQPAKW